MHRTSAERRHNDYKKAKRKQDICIHEYGWEYYDNLHQYSKNKIHCSCPACSAKTNTRKSKGNGPVSSRYANHHFGTSNERYGKKNYKTSDKKKIQKLNYGYEEDMI